MGHVHCLDRNYVATSTLNLISAQMCKCLNISYLSVFKRIAEDVLDELCAAGSHMIYSCIKDSG